VAKTRVDTARRQHAWEIVVPQQAGIEDYLDAKRISLALVDPNPTQPRRGELRDIPELAESIREHGLLQPIVVARTETGHFQIIAGHRRFAAYQWLSDHTEPADSPSQWATIPAIERDATTAQRRMMALVENVSRHSLTESEIVTELRILHDMEGLHQAEIARRLGVSRAWIMQFFRVANDPTVSEHVQTEHLSVAKAYDIVLASSDEARAAALSAALGGAPRRVVRAIAKEGPGTARGAHETGDGASSAGATSGNAQAGSTNTTTGASDAAARPRYVATAETEAGVRDVADLAGELGLTVDLSDLQLTKLFRAAIKAQTGTLDLRAFIRALRADLRRADALVRAAPRKRLSED